VKGLERELEALLAEYSDLAWVVDRALEGSDRQALEALGYTGGAAGGDPFDRSLPDPHERIAGQKELNRARSLMIQANLMATPSAPGSQDPAKLARGRELLLQAQAILEDLTRDYAADPLLRLSLGEVKFGLGDHAGALPYFEQALAEQPDSVSTLFSLGVCYVQTGKTERALKTVRKAQSLDPKFSQAYMFLAWHHRENGSYGKAAWWMQALLDELEPGDPSRVQVEHDLELLERLMKQHQQVPTPPD
jgi:tetratricopeptide (TPR) repeat protein